MKCLFNPIIIRNSHNVWRNFGRMKKENKFDIEEDKDLLHHLLQEQITYISVQEEEERIRDEVIDDYGKGEK